MKKGTGLWIAILGVMTAGAWLALEAWAWATGRPLITDKVREWSRSLLLIPWAGGLLMGALGAHFWWCGA